MSGRIRALLVDDHPTFRLGLRILLEQAPDVVVVGEAGDGRGALHLVDSLQPDVLVLDCEMPDLPGADVARRIRDRGLPMRVIALSAYDTEHRVRGMLDAGAIGYLLKDEAPGVIVDAVRAVARGEGHFSPAVAQKVRAWMEGARPAGLTERELEVLRLMAEGLSNREIARKLCVTERTVEFHVGNVLRKVGAVSRAEAVVWAKERGIVP